jgi:Smg protein
MNERIIDIILYLVTQIRQKTPIEQIDIKRLVSDGYTDAEIGAAFSWLADRTDYGHYDPLTRPRTTFRVLHESERMLFRQDAYGYMLQLVEIGLLSDIEFEIIINRAQMAGISSLVIMEVKEMISTLLAESGESVGGSRLMLHSQDTVH